MQRFIRIGIPNPSSRRLPTPTESSISAQMCRADEQRLSKDFPGVPVAELGPGKDIPKAATENGLAKADRQSTCSIGRHKWAGP
jgi:hypothetical protein